MRINLFAGILMCGVIGSCNYGTESEEQTEGSDALVTTEEVITEIEIVDSSDISCPICGYTTIEELPTDVCLLAYDCKECGETMHPGEGDCCVFCTHGTEKCPSMQE